MSHSSSEHADAAEGEAVPDDLDALVAAPDHHTLLFENNRVRVLDARTRPGERTPIHTHRWPAVQYVLSWGDFVRHDAAGAVLLDSRTVPALQSPPPVLWSEPVPPHWVENVGRDELRVLVVEVKD